MPAPSPPASPPEEEDPCFPSSSLVTKADGTSTRLDALKEGDKIVAATVDGALTTDTVTLLSIAVPEAKTTFLTLTTDGNHTLTVTPEHYLPVGSVCCSALRKAKDIVVGDKVWGVQGGKAVHAQMVAQIATTPEAGLHSPVLMGGTFPVVDSIVTSFDSIEKVTLAKYGLPALLTACKASGTCDAFKQMFLGDDRKYI